ncbi:MAG: hypothetical protein B6U73_03940 [Desulfurococcales archaeon ex4484_204]|nr:MAG: hypothetical protein B6U73_03940 [Desulfurococcales archaeon ex4484_204]
MKADLVIRNVKVFVNGGTLEAVDIGVKDGLISFLGRSYPGIYGGEEVVNGEGLIALPSFIDMHVHIFSPGWFKETYASGTAAAAVGGYSLVCDMAGVGEWQTTTLKVFREKVGIVNREAVIDVALYAGEIYSFSDLKEVPQLFMEGAVGLGEIMLSEPGPIGDDALLLEALSTASRYGKILAAHCENRDIVNYWTRVVRGGGGRGLEALSRARPAIAEAEAILRASTLARHVGARLHVCHVTSELGVKSLGLARTFHKALSSEVAPHHLLLDVDSASGLGLLATVTPPLRARRDREALWSALKEGLIDVISTDHAPYYSSEKLGGDVWSSPPGLGGLEFAFPVVATYAVEKAGMGFYEVQKLFNEHPARILNLYPRRGSISVGSEANVVLVDHRGRARVDSSWIRSRTDYTPYEGLEVRFRVVKNFLRGVLVADEGEVVGRAGRYVPLATGPAP